MKPAAGAVQVGPGQRALAPSWAGQACAGLSRGLQCAPKLALERSPASPQCAANDTGESGRPPSLGSEVGLVDFATAPGLELQGDAASLISTFIFKIDF